MSYLCSRPPYTCMCIHANAHIHMHTRARDKGLFIWRVKRRGGKPVQERSIHFATAVGDWFFISPGASQEPYEMRLRTVRGSLCPLAPVPRGSKLTSEALTPGTSGSFPGDSASSKLAPVTVAPGIPSPVQYQRALHCGHSTTCRPSLRTACLQCKLSPLIRYL